MTSFGNNRFPNILPPTCTASLNQNVKSVKSKSEADRSINCVVASWRMVLHDGIRYVLFVGKQRKVAKTKSSKVHVDVLIRLLNTIHKLDIKNSRHQNNSRSTYDFNYVALTY